MQQNNPKQKWNKNRIKNGTADKTRDWNENKLNCVGFSKRRQAVLLVLGRGDRFADSA